MLKHLEQDKNKDPFKYIFALHSLDKNVPALNNYEALNIDKTEYYSKLLHAQILYKLDQKEKATETYEDVVKSEDPHLENDINEIITNLLASMSNSEGLNESSIQDLEQKFSGELNSDFAFNSAFAYASIDSLKTAAKKLKESYELAKEAGESDSHKFLVLSSYIAAHLVSKLQPDSEFDKTSLKV